MPWTLHQHLTLLEADEPALLDECLAATRSQALVVRRLSPTAVVVDHEQAERLVQALLKKGYTPKVSDVAVRG